MTTEIKLSDGTSLSPNLGIIGINEDLETYEGYDGRLEIYSKDGGACWDENCQPVFTPEQRREIALLMINRWLHWCYIGNHKHA